MEWSGPWTSAHQHVETLCPANWLRFSSTSRCGVHHYTPGEVVGKKMRSHALARVARTLTASVTVGENVCRSRCLRVC